MKLVVLMVEVEQPEGISARKLLLETERHNVITAYRGSVGVELLRRFPNVDVAVLHTEADALSFKETVQGLKAIRSDLPIVAISPIAYRDKDGADYLISSHDPQALLELLANRFQATSASEEA